MGEKINTRKLLRNYSVEKRRQAYKLRKRGLTQAERGEIVGAYANTVGCWLKLNTRYLKVNHGDRKAGDGRQLTTDQERCIQKLIIGKSPDR